MDAREFQQIGHQVVDLLAEYFDHIEEKAVTYAGIRPLGAEICR